MISLGDIFGQDAAIDRLLRAWKADRLPHALIFAGPVGVGKGTTAHALGALFLCEKPKGDEACGKCDSCRVFAADNHPDFHVITKELIRYHDKTGKSKGIDLSINVIRPELIDKANLKAAMGRGKVFIVEQAELMSTAAQNSLLKTLEEPAGRTIIILLTDQPDILLQTVRSRSQMVRFASLDEELVRKELQKRDVNKETAAQAARFASGSLGLALKWIADDVISHARELVSRVDKIITGDSAAGLPEWFKNAAEAYAQKQLERDELSSKDQASREGLTLYLRIAADHLRKKLPELKDPDATEQACRAIDAIARAELYLDSNVNIALIFQQLAVSLERGFATAAR